jgi:hypothetical protein
MFILPGGGCRGGFLPSVVHSAASPELQGSPPLYQIRLSFLILAANFWESFFLLLTTNTETESEAVIEFEMP